MPLPALKYGAAQCTAKCKRSQTRCLNPAAFGCSTCRNHGARRPSSIKRGEAHPNFVHGKETLQAKAARTEILSELRELEALSFELGLATGPRWRGRNPGRVK